MGPLDIEAFELFYFQFSFLVLEEISVALRRIGTNAPMTRLQDTSSNQIRLRDVRQSSFCTNSPPPSSGPYRGVFSTGFS
jgi:hypothetical protein